MVPTAKYYYLHCGEWPLTKGPLYFCSICYHDFLKCNSCLYIPAYSRATEANHAATNYETASTFQPLHLLQKLPSSPWCVLRMSLPSHMYCIAKWKTIFLSNAFSLHSIVRLLSGLCEHTWAELAVWIFCSIFFVG